MRWLGLMLAFGVTACFVVPAAANASTGGGSCSGSGWGGNCSISNTGSGIDIGAGSTRPGSGGSGPRDTPGSFSPDDDGFAQPPEPEVECAFDPCRGNYEVVLLTDAVTIPDVTLADLASFVPARPSLVGEPAGLGVVGMPTNFVAAASAQQIPGVVLGFPVVVLFTPIGFRFAHGDGTSSTVEAGGASWTALGQAEFTPTPTSHVYSARGTYAASATVQYAAAVNFGDSWRPVAGVVEATTGGYEVRVVEVHTALVDKTCVENPTGPGC